MSELTVTVTPEEVAKRKRRSTLVLILISIFALFGFLAFWFFGPNPKIVVSKETTHITAPLAADGYPDYYAVLVADMKQGTTPENNGALLVLRAAWPEYDDQFTKEDEKKLCAELGLDEPPPEEERLIPIDSPSMYPSAHKFMCSLLDFPSPEFKADLMRIVAKHQDNSDGSYEEYVVEVEALYPKHGLEIHYDSEYHPSRYDILFYDEEYPVYFVLGGFLWEPIERPWTRKDAPFLADWLHENQKALDLVVAGAAKKGWYYPPPELLRKERGQFIYDFDNIRGIANALLTRAYLQLGSQRYQDALSDAIAYNQLANHLGNVPSRGMEGIAVGAHSQAYQLMHQIIEAEGITKQKLSLLSEHLDRHPPTNRIIDIYDKQIRYGMISPFMTSSSRQFAKHQYHETQHFLLDYLHSTSIDWNVLLRDQNEYFNQLVTAAKLPTWSQQEAAFDNVSYPVSFGFDVVGDHDYLDLLNLLTRSGRGKCYSALIGGQDSWWHTVKGEFSRNYFERSAYETVRLHFAIKQYQIKNNSLPDSLDALVPDYLKKLPTEPFYKSPYGYKKVNASTYLLYSNGKNGIDDNTSNRLWYGDVCFEGRVFVDPYSDDVSEEEKAIIESIPEEADDVIIQIPRPLLPWPWEVD